MAVKHSKLIKIHFSPIWFITGLYGLTGCNKENILAGYYHGRIWTELLFKNHPINSEYSG